MGLCIGILENQLAEAAEYLDLNKYVFKFLKDSEEYEDYLNSLKIKTLRDCLLFSGSNSYLRAKLQNLADKNGLIFAAPPIRFCTDNGVMIAWAGLERFRKGYTDTLDFKPRPRWPLDMNAPKAAGAGGVKA